VGCVCQLQTVYIWLLCRPLVHTRPPHHGYATALSSTLFWPGIFNEKIIISRISKMCTTSCQILTQKCTKFALPQTPLGELNYSFRPGPLAVGLFKPYGNVRCEIRLLYRLVLCSVAMVCRGTDNRERRYVSSEHWSSTRRKDGAHSVTIFSPITLLY